MQLADIVVVDPHVMGGVPCFRGTRVPVSTLFDNLAGGMTLDEILDDFPTLNRDDLVAVLELASAEVAKSAA